MKRLMIALLLCCCLHACTYENNQVAGSGETIKFTTDDTVLVDKSLIEEIIIEKEEWMAIDSVVTNWNRSMATGDFEELEKFYTDSVSYYGDDLGKNAIIQKVKDARGEMVDYKQVIESDIRLEPIPNTEFIKASFEKEVSAKGADNMIETAYLKLKKENGAWMVMAESDNVTEANLAAKGEDDIPEPEETESDFDERPAENAVRGDFDGNFRKEWLWLERIESCDEPPCGFQIRTSMGNVMSLADAKVGVPANLEIMYVGDVNDDGTDDLGLMALGEESTWNAGHVLSVGKDGELKNLTSFSIWMMSDYSGQRIIKKEKGYFIIIEDDVDGYKEKRIALKK